MNGFQVLDANGEAIKINELDKEAAAFWNKEIIEDEYAYPQVRREGEGGFAYARRKANWFDIVGRPISQLDETGWYSGWKEVARRLIERMETDFIIDTTAPFTVEYGTIDEQENVTFPNDMLIGIYARLSFAKPYIELIQHWESKGYQPKFIKNA